MLRNTFSFSRLKTARGFTLIELLTVVAVIGILASILIPVVGGARKSANKARSKAQFQGYAQALVAYQSEYGYFPDVGNMGGSGNSTVTDLEGDDSGDFITALSGRTTGSNPTRYVGPLNRRGKAFYSFAESEFQLDNDGTVSTTQLADAFNNPSIRILVDSNGTGRLTLPTDVAQASSSATNFRGKVAIWTLKGNNNDYENVFSWN